VTDHPALQLTDVSVRFGGLLALDEITMEVGEGSIVGLIGPNGAGKTTVFNAVTGLVRPSHGCVRLFGEEVTDWSAHARARLGVARTFQRLELFSSLSVRENLVVAAEARAERGSVISDLLALPATSRTRSEAEDLADEQLRELGLAAYADTLAGDVPAGVARLVELARAMCTKPRLVLLDEPSSGLRPRETAELATYLSALRRDHGLAILVVEHDMSFVLGLCEDVYVLDFGHLLAHATPDEIRRDPSVQAAYLGQETAPAPESAAQA